MSPIPTATQPWAPAILAALLFAVKSAAVVPAFAQDGEHVPVPVMIDPAYEAAPSALAPISPDVPFIQPITSFSREWPEGMYNFYPEVLRLYAGDITGNGKPDMIMRISGALDERDPEKSARTGKTFVYFNGNLSLEPDQYIYEYLRPIGDFTGNGHADAVSMATPRRIFEGSPEGYRQTDIQPASLPHISRYFAFFDADGDGHDDFLLNRRADRLQIVFGGDNVLHSYDFERPTGDAIVADIDGTGSNLIRLAGSAISRVIEVYAFNTDRSLELRYEFPAPHLGSILPPWSISSVDVNGNGIRDILVRRYSPNRTYVLLHLGDTEAGFTDRWIRVYDHLLYPAGDVTGDGFMDFIAPEAGSFLVAPRGDPSAIQDPAFQIPLSLEPGETVWMHHPAYLNADAGIGDVTGDGRANIALFFWGTTDLGVRIERFLENGEIEPTRIGFPRSDFDRKLLITVAALGDFDKDGVDDFAILRRHAVEIYRGGPNLFSAPVLTLDYSHATSVVSAAAGNFHGTGEVILAVLSRRVDSSVSQTTWIDFYHLGDLDGRVLSRITPQDVFGPYEPTLTQLLTMVTNVGDVNGNLADDLLISSSMTANPDFAEHAFLYFGRQPIGGSPNVILDYSETLGGREMQYIGGSAAGIGDFNGNGHNDFAVASTDHVFIHYGRPEHEFQSSTTPDIIISMRWAPSDSIIHRYTHMAGIVAGDFTGDGVRNIAFKPHTHSLFPSSGGGNAVHLVSASTPWESQAFKLPYEIFREQPQFPSDRFLRSHMGVLQTIPDMTGNGADEILLTSYGTQVSNAAIFDHTGEPLAVLEGPEKSGLGPPAHWLNVRYPVPAGDFTGNGRMNIMLTQMDVPLWRFRGAPIHVYELDVDAPRPEAPAPPEAFVLYGNYPNPANAMTSIVFDLPESGETSIKVLDLLGRVVMEKDLGFLTARSGYHVSFDTSRWSSGVYPYQVTVRTGGKDLVQRETIVLVR